MEYLNITSGGDKRFSSVGATNRSITVTNVDENTVKIEGFKDLNRAAKHAAVTNLVKENDVDNMTDNPSNHLYHRFDRENKHPKKRKFVYIDPNEPKKLFGVKSKKVNKKKESVSHSQSPSARNAS